MAKPVTQTMFKAEDGRFFHTEAEALYHEKMCKKEEKLARIADILRTPVAQHHFTHLNSSEGLTPYHTGQFIDAEHRREEFLLELAALIDDHIDQLFDAIKGTTRYKP